MEPTPIPTETPTETPGECCGYFKYGQPGKAKNPKQQCFADCCGHMCPPEDCCKVITINYQCGSTVQQYPPSGCPCVYNGINFHGILYKKKNNLPPMPSFDLENKTYSDSIFSLYDCSIPCNEIVVTITTSGCCLYMSGQSIYAVGPGTVTASLSTGSSAETPTETPTETPSPGSDCGNLLLTINGVEGNSVYVQDGESISISLIPQNSDCCQCCEVSRSCGTTSLWAMKQINNKKFLVLNKENFIRKLNILRSIKIKNKNKKLR